MVGNERVEERSRIEGLSSSGCQRGGIDPGLEPSAEVSQYTYGRAVGGTAPDSSISVNHRPEQKQSLKFGFV